MTIFAQIEQAKQQLLHEASPFAVTKDLSDGLLKYTHAPKTLYAAITAARSESSDTFLVYQDTRWSFADFYSAVDKIAGYLATQGVQQGERVALCMRNRPEWCISFTALIMLGAVPAPINSFNLGAELNTAIQNIQAQHIILDRDRLERLLDIGVSLPGVTICVEPDELREYCCDFANIIANPVQPYPEPKIQPSSPCLILFTSGATSCAKPVESNQESVSQSLYNVGYIAALSGMCSPDIVQNIQALQLPPVTLTAVPLFHVSGLHAQFLVNLINHRRMVFIYKWDLEEVIPLMAKEHVTIFNGAPAMVHQLVTHPAFTELGLNQQLYGLGFGGAGIPEKVVNEVKSALAGKMVGSGFGMTETNGAVSAGSGEVFNAVPKASGVICPIMQVRVVDECGSVLTNKGIGEIQIKSVTVMNRYVGVPETENTMSQDGWLATGDIGYVDEHDMLYVVDRKKDVVNRAGENISAAEVESCISTFSNVNEVCVVGAPDENLGERVVAVISTEQAKTFSTPELLAHVKQRLASFKVPTQVVLTSAPLPRNPAGKLMKHLIRDLYVATQQDSEEQV